ncbi:hypothetical protein HMJ29_07830 [Hymenobacter taeanensis]|uniref:Uncharacterized protein n=1 Tax=Hymenobacter taeanensis TaxID=2735321 RepID=A0A6M6BGF5_9BACT|nr:MULTISPECIES: hypothetical protein [Hymenobacter]QJX46854.1 hypothetical protein HMJ29_07830 [Hymenobacter taeanensis]UOQ80726.1 hypothetical protein MUN83_18180 [Hymenobacter sp. 5414T-23]
MVFSTLKDSYLQKLGFVRLSLYRSWDYPVAAPEAEFAPVSDMRYQHRLVGRDGTRLYACSWIHEPGYMLTTAQHISSLTHVVAELDSDDVVVLQQHIEAFFMMHGGSTLPLGPEERPQLTLS